MRRRATQLHHRSPPTREVPASPISSQASSTPSPAAPVTETIPEQEQDTRLAPMYNVVLLDDQDHTYPYVIEMLRRLFGHGRIRAFLMAREVDTTGRVIVHTDTLERAEFKRDQIHAYGPDRRIPRCKGSMSAIVEPVEE